MVIGQPQPRFMGQDTASPRQGIHYSGGELTRPCLGNIRSTSTHGVVWHVLASSAGFSTILEPAPTRPFNLNREEMIPQTAREHHRPRPHNGTVPVFQIHPPTSTRLTMRSCRPKRRGVTMSSHPWKALPSNVSPLTHAMSAPKLIPVSRTR
jgi:hypothetical protein